MKDLQIIGTEKSHRAGLEMDFFPLTGTQQDGEAEMYAVCVQTCFGLLNDSRVRMFNK